VAYFKVLYLLLSGGLRKLAKSLNEGNRPSDPEVN
jgi:hypothetical protein